MDYIYIFVQTVNLIWSFRTDDNIQLAHTNRGAQLGVNLLPPPVSTIHCIHSKTRIMLVPIY